MEDNGKNDKMLVYFMGQTNERLLKIEEKLVELIAFRAEVKAEAKNQAVMVSILIAVLGTIVNYLLRKYIG